MLRTLIFDLDETLVSRTPELTGPFPQVPALLETLHLQGYLMYVASFNPLASQILRHYRLRQYFQAVAPLVSIVSKVKLIQQLAVKQAINPYQAVIFDDDPRNIQECQAAGLRAVKVNPVMGVTMEQVQKSLEDSSS